MNLNKLLCKYLDEDGRGYVTIGNLITAATALPALLIICAGYVRGATLLIRGNYYEAGMFDMPILAVGAIDFVCIVITTVLTVLVFAAFLARVIQLTLITIVDVWYTEITTCERKDGDEKL